MAGSPIFRNPLPVAIPTGSVSTILGADFNGDGHEDVLLVSPTEALVVYIANGTGPFAAPVVTPLAFATGSPGIGDVNRDGRVDLIVTDWSTRSAMVFLGAGDGSFLSGATFPTGIVPTHAAVADFNGDTLMDVAITTTDTHDTDTIVVFFGNGAGSFSSGPTTSLESDAWKLATADMNRDGKADLIIESWQRTSIALGHGNGTFTLKSGATNGGTAVADFNHDGIPDLAVAAGGDQDWFIEVAMGTGDGSLAAPVRYVCGYSAESIAAADLDGDANLDLLAAGTAGSTVTVLRGNADGTFRNPEHFLSGPSTWKVLAGDYDRDHKIDFLTLDYNSEVWALSFVRGNGDGTFDTYRAFHTNDTVPVLYPGLQSAGGIPADMNDDGHPDVVVSQKSQTIQFQSDLAVMLNDGTGALATAILTPTGSEGVIVAVADLTGDGKQDVVTLRAGPVAETYPGLGNGHFGPKVSSNLLWAGKTQLFDFDGDAKPDLLMDGGYGATVHRGNGDGTFGAGIQTTGNMSDLYAGDLNGDGRDDFVSCAIRQTTAYLSDGTGHFTPVVVTLEEISVGALADFNADGKLDLLFTTYAGTDMRFGNGDGTFAAFGSRITFIVNPVPNYPSEGPTATADVNRDGHLDIAFGSTVYLGAGDGKFPAAARFRTNGIGSIAFADMDGNGWPDLLLQNGGADNVAVLTTLTAEDPSRVSSVTLTSDEPAPQYARPIVFTATMGEGEIPATGFVTFASDGVAMGIIALRDGKATFTFRFSVGVHEVTATYSGDDNYLPSTDTMQMDVARAATKIFIKGSPNPQRKNVAVTVTVALSAPSATGLPGATGAITLRDGDTPLAVPIVNGFAQVKTLDVGDHVLSADYPGDANYAPSTASYTQTITKPLASISLTNLPASPIAGNPLTLRASFGFTSITGSISFHEGETLLGVVPLTQGQADLQVTLTPGSHSITAKYGGDATWDLSQRTATVYVFLQWGSPIVATASGTSSETATILWTRVHGAASYTLWRKTGHTNPWQVVATYPENYGGITVSMPADTSQLFAVAATDGGGNVSPMSAPDLATTYAFQEFPLIVKAKHFTDLRSVIQSVRAFAALGAYPYTNAIQAGQPIRAVDLRELRTALAAARATIGLPAITFTDNVITAQASPVRAAHILELRAGAN